METVQAASLELRIATGRSRHETKWKNTATTWGSLIKKLSKTTTTPETIAEYMAMSKADQDTRKDVGGFVGGTLREGRRKNGHVLSRSIITLDADFAPPDFWSDVELLCPYAVCAYSTHKHTPKKPRLRLLIPLTRDVSPEEYEAIARKIAEGLGIDHFDDTTYEPTRLMYWPSTPSDVEYFFKCIDAPALDPATVLAQYPDWRDTSFWPESGRVRTARKKTADKQGDPLEKEGLIGAFCRAHSIQDAIATFIPDAYTECNTPGRYTYARGSTAAGLVIYEDKFAYSNHGSDPISGQLCNAFDLVRIHKYGELDLDAKEDTPVNRLPSWTAMMEMVRADEATRVQIGEDKLAAALDDFEVYTDAEDAEADKRKPADKKKDPPEDKDWLKKLTVGKGGGFEATIDNILLIIKNDPNLRGLGGRDQLRDSNVVLERLPWARSGRLWTDLDDAGLRHYLEKVYTLEGRNKIADAVSLAFEARAYHPVKQYLDRTTWDGIPRVETLLIDYLGADDSPYVRTVTRKTLAAAIARIYEPGCKFDYMLTLVGKQGIGKSMLIKRLGGEWASDTLTDIKGKEAYEALDGVWLMEMGELAALRKSEREAIKNYVSKQEDTYRKAFGHNVTQNRRQCIFIGTTNDKDFLDDNTGSRRFWVVDTDPEKRTKTVWDDLTDDEVAQVWAEAREIYRKGERIMYLDESIAEAAARLQLLHSATDAYLGLVAEFVDTPLPDRYAEKSPFELQQWYAGTQDFKDTSNSGVQRKRVCAVEVWVVGMGKDAAACDKMTTRRINNCLEELGWVKDLYPTRYGAFGSQRGYSRG